jgi:toxin ParE1/3/4
MVGYRLSKQADADFESIYLFGVMTFGLQQAEEYVAGLEARFERLAEHPLRYPSIDHVRPGYRASVYGSHTIYYRNDEGGVLIVRILGKQDFGPALAEQPGDR